MSRNTDIDCILVYNFLIPLTFFESLKIVLISMVTILIMSAKNGYDVTNQILSRDSNYIADLVM